ncbi:FK506 binding protein [Aureococcus anophagefferens]|nr:FK506 binding protein [Aureococcus anophagefferens]
MVACNSLALLLSLRVSVAFMASPPKSLISKIAPLKAEATDETLYALGVNVATQLGDIRKLFPTEEMPQILRGIEDYLTNKVADPTDILRANANDINAMLQDRMVKVVADEQVKGLAAQEEAAAREGATRTASGLVIEHVKEGAGPQPTARRSRARGEPAQFAVKQVIAGWQEALLLMAEGGTAKLTIPADIAYGDAGSGDKIPGGATICFEVELIKVLSGGVGGLVL